MLERNFEKTTSNALRPFEKVKITKVCPACSSVFVTKKECEACGLQFWVDLLGEPFGERSFFLMRDDFKLNRPWFLKLIPHKLLDNHKTISKYRRSLLKRFEVLTGYFFDEVEQDQQRRKAFLYEATELMKEFILFGGASSALWKMIERGEKHALSSILYRSLDEIEKGVEPSRQSSFEFQLLGHIKSGLLVEFFLMVAAVVTAAFLVLKYLNS